jgi:arylformamidase
MRHSTPKQVFDISPMLSSETAVWPGDLRLSRNLMLRLEDGHSVELSSLQTTVHIGAHADAPSHYQVGAPSIEAAELTTYFGACRVIHIRQGSQISARDLLAKIQPGDLRVLVRTDSFPNPYQFNENFASFSAEMIDAAADAGVRLLGIDTPSIDPFHSKDLPAHHRLFERGLRNLECLDLSQVSEGEYELIALPLRLKGFDASPTRAILVQF